MKLGFMRSDVDPNLYFKVQKDMTLNLVLYVDDLFMTGVDPLIYQCKRELASEFGMKDLGLMHYFLSLEVWQKLGEISLSQEKYIVKLLERCGMVDCRSVSTLMELNFKKLCGSVVGPELENLSEYRQLVGALMSLSGIHLSKNLVFHDCSKHIDIRYHFIWDMVQRGAIRLQHIKKPLRNILIADILMKPLRNVKFADILMKPLRNVKFLAFRERLGVMERPSHEGPA
eukprot:PITA_02260